MMGTKVDLYSSVQTTDIREFDLIEIGARSTINRGVTLRPEEFTSDSVSTCPRMRLGRIRLAAGAWVGHRAVLPLCEASHSTPLSYVATLGTRDESSSVPEEVSHLRSLTSSYGLFEVLLWIPSTFIGVALMAGIRVAQYYPVFMFSKWFIGLITETTITRNPDVWNVLLSYSLGLQPFFLNPFITLLAEQQVFAEIGAIAKSSVTVMVFLPVNSYVNALAGILMLIVLKWVVLWRVTPQTYKRGSFCHFRHWFWQMSLYSAYERLSWWSDTWVVALAWKLMGSSMRLENWMNGFMLIEPDLVKLGKRSAVGWTGSVNPETVYGDWIVCDRVTVPDGSMVGMHGVLMGGSRLPDGCVLGVLTPLLRNQEVEAGTRLVLGGANVPATDINEPDWWRVQFTSWRWFKYFSMETLYVLFGPLLVLIVRTAAIGPGGWVLLELRRRWGRIALALLPAGFLVVLLTGMFVAY